MIETDFSQNSEQEDFISAEEEFQASSAGTFTDDQIAKLRKREIKTDVISAVISAGMSSIPMIYNYAKSKNSPIKYKPGAMDFVKIGLFNLVPLIKVIDSTVLKGRISNLIEEKTPFKFRDVRNVIGLAYAYQPFHNIIMNTLENSTRRMYNEQGIPKNNADIINAWLTGVNLVAPYVVYKFTDENLTFAQKCSSIIPIGALGGWVRKLCMSNPKAAQAYEVAGALVKVASFGNNSISNAIRPQQGSALNKGATAINNAVNIASDLLGVNRSGFSTYGYNGGYNNGWGGNGYGSRWGY